MRAINDEALIFEIKLSLSSEFTAKVFSWIWTKIFQRLKDIIPTENLGYQTKETYKLEASREP